MGQIANQTALELFIKIKDKVKGKGNVKKREKNENAT